MRMSDYKRGLHLHQQVQNDNMRNTFANNILYAYNYYYFHLNNGNKCARNKNRIINVCLVERSEF
jgi:hypothetical protein